MPCSRERFTTVTLLTEVAVIRDAVYMELINLSKPHTTGGLRFSRKASVANVAQELLENTNF